MAVTKYTCPPQTASGAGTFSDNLVGLQLVAGGGLTQGNFEFITSTNEKENRTFTTGTFSDPISLESLGIENINQSKTIVENNFKVYPNFDLTQVTNFTLYGSMVKRISASITTIVSYFPAGIESSTSGLDYTTGPTAENIVFSEKNNETSFELKVSRIRNPFEIDFTNNSTRNIALKEIQVSPLRDFTKEFSKYSLFLNGVGYTITGLIPTTSLSTGTLKIFVQGNPFLNQGIFYESFVIRPNDYEVNKVFNEEFDQVENFLLNRNVSPIYTSTFQVPREAEDGTYYIDNTPITWPKYGEWNIDILTKQFENYISKLNTISISLDGYKTNLVSRFLTTGAFKEFDTIDQKIEKVLQLYGRSFDETMKFITALSFMNSVNYNVKNDIPSQLLKNLAQTLGWSINISPISSQDLLSSVFGEKNLSKSIYPGVSQQTTPDELNYQFYRNLILNSAYLFKSKGTRKSIEVLMRLIGAPEALVEFNEYVYLADQRINLSQFNTQYAQIDGGTYVQQIPILEESNIFSIFGVQYTGFTTTFDVQDVNVSREDFPMDEFGFPQAPPDSEEYYFQKGSGWFEQTPSHRAPAEVNLTNSVFVGNNPNFQTTLIPYTYGQTYLDRYRKFPFMDLGYNLRATIDNNKSWYDNEVGLRINLDSTFTARYITEKDNLVLNVKNVDLFMNPAQGIVYDIWYMSRQYNYPIPNEGLNYVPPTYCNPDPYSPYPRRGGVDWTEINPQPKRKTFFEFAQSFWKNMINVRNRQFASSYPTLESIYWKYIESGQAINVPKQIFGAGPYTQVTPNNIPFNNYNYRNMMEYVNGIGDYWIRLVEQMIPASTIWNTGTRMENSAFHRQKFVWRRQEGCQLIPVKCKPCVLETNLFSVDCPIEAVETDLFPWKNNPRIQQISGVLGDLLNTYLQENGFSLDSCVLNTLQTEWFAQIKLDNLTVVSIPFFNGLGYTNTPEYSFPSEEQWFIAAIEALDGLKNYGYGYTLIDGETALVKNNVCSIYEKGANVKFNIAINFDILCNK